MPAEKFEPRKAEKPKIDPAEKKIDRELKDTFPASDPPSGNIFVGAPTNDECAHCEDRHSNKK